MQNRGFGASGGHLGAIWVTSGSQGGESDEKHGSFPSPGVPIWGPFWHQKRKNPEKKVYRRGNWQAKAKAEKNNRKMSSSRRGAHAIQPRRRSRNDVFVFDKKTGKIIENDLPNGHFYRPFATNWGHFGTKSWKQGGPEMRPKKGSEKVMRSCAGHAGRGGGGSLQ